MSAPTIRALEPKDVEPWLAAFERAFERDANGLAPCTRRDWSWTYRENPAGSRSYVALEDRAVRAHFGASLARTWIDGREASFAQGVDLFVDPTLRAGLQRPGAFVETARACLRAHGGVEDVVYYGWPMPAAWRIGHRFLGFELVRTELALVEERASVSHAVEALEEVVEIERFDHQTKWLWDRCADQFGASTIRDAAFCNWRFVDHPTRRYARLGVRDAAGILRGLAVVRRADFVVADVDVVVEWLVPPGEREVGELLLRALRAHAARERARAIAWIAPPWSPWFGWLQERGFRAHPTDYRCAAIAFDKRFGARWLARHWWYQLSDTDLV